MNAGVSGNVGRRIAGHSPILSIQDSKSLLVSLDGPRRNNGSTEVYTDPLLATSGTMVASTCSLSP